MSGYHPDDPFSLPTENIDYVAATRRSVRNMDIAHSVDLDMFPIDNRVKRIFNNAIDDLSETGMSVANDDPEFNRSRAEMLESWQTGFYLVLAESLDLLNENEGIDLLSDHRDELETNNIEAAEAGIKMSAVDYRKNDVARTEAFQSLQDFFQEYDLLITPTLAVPPFEHGIWGPNKVNGEEVGEIIGWCLTWLFNMTGHPAASVPAGFTDDGLPVGLQIVGPRFGDDKVLAAAGAYERIRPWHSEYERVNQTLS
jgi:Asp-tRNA(Asn)/Glu-tRNA(Gln) amidotransferase A subunit family amidase